MRLADSPNCCCLYSKGKNFRANHNSMPPISRPELAVAYIAKVRILEQITTNEVGELISPWLLLI